MFKLAISHVESTCPNEDAHTLETTEPCRLKWYSQLCYQTDYFNRPSRKNLGKKGSWKIPLEPTGKYWEPKLSMACLQVK